MTVIQHPPYLWTKQNWIRNPDLPESFFERDRRIQSMEEDLMSMLGVHCVGDAIALALTKELYSSYKIENEHLDETLLYSSVIRELNLDLSKWRQYPRQRARENNVVAATVRSLRDSMPITPSLLCDIHGMLDDNSRTKWGEFRTKDVCVVSGTDKVVYEGPPHGQVPFLVEGFCDWWNNDRIKLPLSARSACAHAFFVLIHPFEDGNGRISRLLMEKALVSSREDVFRPYGLSREILDTRKQYAFVLRHIHDSVNANGMDGLCLFASFIQNIREQAITRAMENARRLMKLEELFSRLHDEGINLSPEERIILKTMNESDRRWNRYEATMEIEDPQAGTMAWNHLIELGIIKKSRIQFSAEPEQGQEGEICCFDRS